MKLARSSPTKAIAGIAIISAGGRSPAKVSDRQPAPTKAIPRGKNFVTVSLFYLTRKARQLKLGKFTLLSKKVTGTQETSTNNAATLRE